jgi:hypothetical protein
LSLSTTSQVKKAMRPVELTLVMDTTGSMSTDNKIGGAKTAAKSLLNTLYGGPLASYPESEFIRVSLVPFAAAVRLNQSAYDFNLGWIDTTGANPLSHLNFNDPTWDNFMAWGKIKNSSDQLMQWNGCVEARGSATSSAGDDLNQNDVAPGDPITGPDTLFPAYFSPDTVTGYGTTYIGTSGTPNELTSLTNAQKLDGSDAGLLYRQKNQNKYEFNGANVKIYTEAYNTTGPWTGCAASAIVPMTYDRRKLEAGIDAMQARGPTLIAEGLNWGWKTISPTFRQSRRHNNNPSRHDFAL